MLLQNIYTCWTEVCIEISISVKISNCICKDININNLKKKIFPKNN